MKKILLFAIGLMLVPLFASAQSMPGFSYQAIARDANGDIIANKKVGIEISILENSIDGNVVYVEEFYPVTNNYGIINLTIGTGNSTYGEFSSIDWSSGSYFVAVGLDPDGGNDFVNMSTSQLLSVPYAKYAETAETAQTAESVKDLDVADVKALKSSVSSLQTQLKSISYELLGSGTFTDARDGQVYSWVKTADNNVWMADNLKADIYTDGTPITGVKSYNNDTTISDEYGKLYTYQAITEDGKQICPDGYRMPTDAEWSALLSKYGGPVFAGAKMKETGTLHWNVEASGVTNEAETKVIPAGMVGSDGASSGLGSKAYIWTTTVSSGNPDYVYAYQYTAEHNIVVKISANKNAGLSIRCIKE